MDSFSFDLSLKVDSMANRIMKLHRKVTTHLEDASARYMKDANAYRRAQRFKVGELVMVHLSKSQLPIGSHSKLSPIKSLTFLLFWRRLAPAYCVDLPICCRITLDN